jgi:hypothetical protein
MLAAVGALWLCRGKHCLKEWEKIALAALFLLSVSPRTMAEASHLPIGPFVALAFAALVASQVLRRVPRDATGRSIARTAIWSDRAG